ncbi:MAG: hypothetical protein MUE69_33290 [Myxococcota bacterium]|jgi:hypothetical protein|nr:hypothetical protein [Myxococcota bacterium]
MSEALDMRIAELERVEREADSRIDAAYWRFTRAARALPPVLAEPEAYERRRAARAELRHLRAKRGVA